MRRKDDGFIGREECKYSEFQKITNLEGYVSCLSQLQYESVIHKPFLRNRRSPLLGTYCLCHLTSFKILCRRKDLSHSVAASLMILSVQVL